MNETRLDQHRPVTPREVAGIQANYRLCEQCSEMWPCDAAQLRDGVQGLLMLLHEVDGVLGLIVHRPNAMHANRRDADEVLRKLMRYTRSSDPMALLVSVSGEETEATDGN